jgi:hypothetical protein
LKRGSILWTLILIVNVLHKPITVETGGEAIEVSGHVEIETLRSRSKSMALRST